MQEINSIKDEITNNNEGTTSTLICVNKILGKRGIGHVYITKIGTEYYQVKQKKVQKK